MPPNSPHWDFPVDQRAHVDATLGRKSMLWEKLSIEGDRTCPVPQPREEFSSRKIRMELLGWALWPFQL